MKKIILLWMQAILFMGGLVGCYEDKGNYDYHDINEISFNVIAINEKTGTPMEIPEDGYCRYKQPGEAMTVKFSIEPNQTIHTGDDNLEYYWRVEKNAEKTEYDTKEIALDFPASQKTSYVVYCSVTDKTTNVSLYKKLSVNTVRPYMFSWLVLNQSFDKDGKGPVLISAVEDPDSIKPVITFDAYGDLGKTDGAKFEKATDLVYSMMAGNDFSQPEVLQVVTDDNIYIGSPFTMDLNSLIKLPGGIDGKNRTILYGRDGNMNNLATAIVDNNGRIYMGTMKMNSSSYMECGATENYSADKIGEIGFGSGSLCFWDKANSQFKYVDIYSNDVYPFDEKNDWKGTNVLWMGHEPVNADNDKNALGMAVIQESGKKTYSFCHFSSDGYVIKTEDMGILPFESNSLFLTSPFAFEHQLFYTVGSQLYRLNFASKESDLIYDAGATITHMSFRVLEHNQNYRGDRDYRVLGLAVENTNGEGELHQIEMTIAGDLIPENTKVFKGFGKIKDICFTFCNRKI